MSKDTTVNNLTVQIADEKYLPYVDTILETIAAAAKVRGTGIAKRSPEYITQKMKEGKAIIMMKTSDAAKAEEVLKASGVELAGADSF